MMRRNQRSTEAPGRLSAAIDGETSPRVLRLPGHRGTTAQVGSLFPWQADQGIGARGPLVGTTWPWRAGWFYDPFALYSAGLLDNPNIMVYGEVGSAKSSSIKCLLARQIGLLGKGDVGRQAFIVDPKSEYRGLADAMGMRVVPLRPGGAVRINPLGRMPGSVETPEEILSRRTRLVVALLSSMFGRPLDPEADAIVGWAMESLTYSRTSDDATLVELAELLREPSEQMIERAGLPRREFVDRARLTWTLLDKLVHRDLRGMFDGTVNMAAEWARSGTGVVLDISAVFNDKTLLPLVMLAAISVLQAIYMVGDADDEWSVPRRFLVVDEGWSITQNEEATRFLQENWKLARRRGVANIAICHRVTDLGAQADSGTAISKIGEGLLDDAQTQIVFRTSPHVIEQTAAALGLTAAEAAELPRLPKGCALWKVRGRSAFVQHIRSSYERRFTDTDGRVGEVA
jgi:type IV secretory pathway VirB4 component